MDWNRPETKALLDAFLTLRTKSEARRFLRDLMTEGEIAEFAKRFAAARMLADAVPYPIIQQSTGLSSTTIARVSKWLQGNGGGYRLIINRYHHHAPLPQRERIALMS